MKKVVINIPNGSVCFEVKDDWKIVDFWATVRREGFYMTSDNLQDILVPWHAIMAVSVAKIPTHEQPEREQ